MRFSAYYPSCLLHQGVFYTLRHLCNSCPRELLSGASTSRVSALIAYCMQRLEVTLVDVPGDQLWSSSRPLSCRQFFVEKVPGVTAFLHGCAGAGAVFGYFRKIPHHCEYVFKLTVSGSYSVWLFEPVLRGEGPWGHGLPPCMRQLRCRRCLGCFRKIPDRCEAVLKHSECHVLFADCVQTKQ